MYNEQSPPQNVKKKNKKQKTEDNEFSLFQVLRSKKPRKAGLRKQKNKQTNKNKTKQIFLTK